MRTEEETDVAALKDTNGYLRRVLNAFGGNVSLAEGAHVELPPGTLQQALSEYAVAHAKPLSVVAQKKYDVRSSP